MQHLAWIVIAITTCSCYAQAAQSAELDAVVHRATEYVTQYEAELGNLIGTEDYLQTAVWPVDSLPQRTCRNCPVPKPKVVNRRTTSDFMLIEVGDQWSALRNVHVVDGKNIESEKDEASPNTIQRLLSMRAENTKYNVGDVLRETNLPTFALQVLRDDQVSRFTFERAGSGKIAGVAAWRVKFREIRGTTLVVNDKGGENLYSTGTLWIEPNTGKVLKTEFHTENRLVNPSISSDLVVTYTEEKNLGILVPETMAEHYETSNNIIDCRAQYSNFHRFHVETHFDFGSPTSRRPIPERN